MISEEIRVKGAAAVTLELKFSRHGPIFFEDREHHLAYALRSQLHERGTAEYLGGLRLDQATSARDCLTAANFMPMPPTNLVCADADGNIAFRIAVFAPVRKGWTGRLPVPGTGQVRVGTGEADRSALRVQPGARLHRHRQQQHAAARTSRRRTPTYPADRRYRRHERIVEMITQREVVHDRRHDPHAARFVQLGSGGGPAVSSAAGRSDDPHVERARALVDGWDAVMDRDSSAAAHLHDVAARGRPRGGAQRDRATPSSRGCGGAIDEPDQVAGRRTGASGGGAG